MWRHWLLAILLCGAAAAAEPPGLPASGAKIDSRLRAAGAPRGSVQVYVRLASTAPEVLGTLRARGLAIELVNPALHLVQGRADRSDLPPIAALEAVEDVRPVDRARTRTGAVTSEGDAAARADLVRAAGYDGTGIVVGVLSDGIDSLAASQASGDLAAVTVPADPRCRVGSGDEGTAMLEVVHDLAPGAGLLFSGAATSLEFIDSVGCLVAAGARVLVDDLGFFGEPYFQDGAVALAVRDAVRAGVSYVTAAGNDAERHLTQSFRSSLFCGDLHDFGGEGSSCEGHVLLQPLETLDCILQWNDPFPGSANDYDLLLVDGSLSVLAESDGVQSGSQPPLEEVSWINGPDTQLVGLQIRRVRAEPRLLKIFCLGGQMEYLTPPGSIFGHAALTEVITTGAIDVGDPGLDEIQPFSSRGPVDLFFPVARRHKPDLAAFEQVTTAVPGFAPFSGTSAAAPHVAAAAALLLGKNPFLAPAEVQALLRGAARDIGPVGFDDAAGAGRLDVFAAADDVVPPACVATSDCGGGCALDGCHAGLCTASAVRGGDRACAGQIVPRTVAARFERACALVARAPTLPKRRRMRRLLRRATNALARATRIATRAGRDSVSPACATSMTDALARAAALVPKP